MASLDRPFPSPHLYRASRFLLLFSSTSLSSVAWRWECLSRIMPPTTPRAEVMPTVPKSMTAMAISLPSAPAGTTSPYPTVHRVCTTK